MITLSEIEQLVSNPTLVNGSMLDDLRSLSEKYPYSQVFSILYLKGLKNTGNINFDEELTKHSYRISDRVQLYNLIQDSEITIEKESEPIEITNEVKDAAPTIEVESITEYVDETTEPTEEITLAISEIPEEKTVAEESYEEDITQPSETTDALEENILHHAFTASYQLDELSEEEEDELDQRQNEKEELIAIEDVQPISQEKEIKNDSKHSFTDWLKANNNYEEDDNKDREHIKQIVTNFENFDPSDDLFGEVEKPKVEFFSPTKKAKESLDDSSVPVSETLAKIYALQGNYPKAIEAYEQLSLINPEKKIFFADQIKELKKKIHTK